MKIIKKKIISGTGRDEDRERRYAYFSSTIPPVENSRQLTDRERDAIRMSILEIELAQAVEEGDEELVENIKREMRILDRLLSRPQITYDANGNYFIESDEDEIIVFEERNEADEDEDEDEGLQERVGKVLGKEKKGGGNRKQELLNRISQIRQVANYFLENIDNFNFQAEEDDMEMLRYYVSILLDDLRESLEEFDDENSLNWVENELKYVENAIDNISRLNFPDENPNTDIDSNEGFEDGLFLDNEGIDFDILHTFLDNEGENLPFENDEEEEIEEEEGAGLTKPLYRTKNGKGISFKKRMVMIK